MYSVDRYWWWIQEVLEGTCSSSVKFWKSNCEKHQWQPCHLPGSAGIFQGTVMTYWHVAQDCNEHAGQNSQDNLNDKQAGIAYIIFI